MSANVDENRSLHLILKLFFELNSRRTAAARKTINYTTTIQNIAHPHEYMSCANVNHFIRLARSYGYDLKEIITDSNSGEHYRNFNATKTKRDIQILYMFPSPGAEAGHAITTLYQNGVMYAYDSSEDSLEKKLEHFGPQIRKIANIRYGEKTRIVFVEPKTKQPDKFTCAIFAIEFVVLLMHRYNPKTTGLRLEPKEPSGDITMELREHVYEMVRKKKISLPPGIKQRQISSPET